MLFRSVIILFTGCGGQTYSLKQATDEIESIEIVSAESSLEYTVIKTLSDTEKQDFIEQFQHIEFSSYIWGDPMSVNGNAVKITYSNGDYEMICYSWRCV